MRSPIWLILGVIGTSTAHAEQKVSKPLSTPVATAVDAAVQKEMDRQQLVGVAVGIIREGEITYLKGYGLADREKKSPVTTETIFNWASNSKPLAAVAAMQLVEKGKLDLDADVRTLVPEFPDKGSRITMRQLLSHQSGIPHYSNGKIVPTVRKYSSKQPFADPVNSLDKFNRSDLIFTPGEKTAYSSYAYILASAVIQRAGKDAFLDQIKGRIAQPLALRSLVVDDERTQRRNWAAGYVKDRSGQVVPAKEEAHFWKHGGGAFKSDVGDFARWARALIVRELVSEETEKAMWTAQPLSNGDKTTWGLGFTVEQQGGLKVSHNGKQDEATSRMVLYPSARHGIVVMSNGAYGDMGAISTAIYRVLK
jgi:CubicO group peptidase (beta-lactamase class C family)